MYRYDYSTSIDTTSTAQEIRDDLSAWGSRGWRLVSAFPRGGITFYYWEKEVIEEPREMLA